MSIKIIDKHKAQLIVSIGTGQSRRRAAKCVEYKTKKDLERQYNEFYTIVSESISNDTIADLVDNHYKQLVESKSVKATTLKGYDYARRKLTADIGSYSAREVKPTDIQKYVNRLTTTLSAKSVKNIISYLSSCYDEAIMSGMLATNPCTVVKLPKIKKPKIVILTPAQIQILLDASMYYGLDFKVCCELALYMGLRRSEILGLKKSDIDLDKKLLYVRHTRHEIDGKTIIQSTKTEESQRTLVIPNIVLTDILDLIAQHKAYETDYLILVKGKPMRPDYTKETLQRLRKKANLPDITLHGLRHTCASMLNSSGAFDLAEISHYLGHSNITTTLGVYTHIFGDAYKSAQRISDFFDRQNNPKNQNYEKNDKKNGKFRDNKSPDLLRN